MEVFLNYLVINESCVEIGCLNAKQAIMEQNYSGMFVLIVLFFLSSGWNNNQVESSQQETQGK